METLIFDMDGLLINSEKIYRESWIFVANKLGVNLNKENFDMKNGQSLKESIKKLKLITNDDNIINKFSIEREKYIKNQLDNKKISLKPYVVDVLDKATEMNLTLCLATSTYKKRAKMILTALGIFKYFDYVSFGDEISNPKPSPDIYKESLRKSGSSIVDTIAVEDSITGATAASRAGLKVILIPDSESVVNYKSYDLDNINIYKTGKTLGVLLDELKED